MKTGNLLLISAVLRALLTAWSYVQDNYMSVKYTDIDYSVFTDAARYVSQGQSPFLRSTYRYSPLLAYLMVPNVLWTEVFGKVSISGRSAPMPHEHIPIACLLKAELLFRLAQHAEA